MLLSPILKCNKTKSVKPKIVLLCDNSKSTRSALTSSYSTDLRNIIQKIVKDKFEVEAVSFDKIVKPFDSLSQSGSKTNIFSALNSTLSVNFDNNLDRVILVTDGIYNEGNNPIFVNNRQMTPIDVILLGDTTKVGDYNIENLEYNALMFHKETNTVNVFISAQSAINSSAQVILEEVGYMGSKIVGESKIESKSNFFSHTVQFKLSNLTKGKHNYRVFVKSDLKERNLSNNVKYFSLQVVDGNKQIDILSSFPHPDLTALKSWIGANRSFKVNLTISESDITFSDNSDLVVLYQMPNQFNNGKLIFERAKSLGKSVLFILGTKSDYNSFNQIQRCYQIDVTGNILQDYGPRLNTNFAKFYLQGNMMNEFQNYPPLSNYLITVKPKLDASHLFFAKLGRIDSEQPLISFSNQDNIYVGLIAAENIWRWRMHNYQSRKNFNETQDMVEKLVNYLAIKKDKKQLATFISEDRIAEGDNFTIMANTFNELYQPARASKVQCVISRDGLKYKEYEMLPLENSYSLSPKDLTAGYYQYEISAQIGGKLLKDQGSFSVFKEDIESMYNPSNFEDMNALVSKSGGELFLWNDRQKLINLINSQEEVKDKMFEEVIRLRANDIFWLLLSILFVLSLEWLIRKYFGLI